MLEKKCCVQTKLDKFGFVQLPCVQSLSSLGIVARQLSSHHSVSSMRAMIYATSITQGTISMKHGV